ncbi:hypothetical protein Tco_1532141 [Tanacetum coccineum]
MDWSMMLPELLDIIAQKHNFYYEDYISFAGVCKSWKSAASRASIKGHYTNGPPSRFPCLLLTEKVPSLQSKATTPMEADGENILNTTKEALPQTSGSLILVDKKKEDNVRELFFLSNRTIRKVRVPETSGKLCMSSCGWLLTIGNNCAAKLIHPLSQEIINLPKIDTFPEFLEDSEWDRGIRKLVLLNPSSSLSMLLVVLWGCSGKLGLCRPGDNYWIDVEARRRSIFDITYQNGLVYCFDVHNRILAYDVYSKNPETTMVEIAWLTRDLYDEWVRLAYIIGGLEENSLLVVIRETKVKTVNDKLCKETYKTKSFKVFKYDLESKGSEGWSVVKDLGRRALFVGYNSSFWMEEDPARVINENCIYYTDDDPVLYGGSILGGGRDMGIYHMHNGTIESHYTGESRSHLTPPIWVQPM